MTTPTYNFDTVIDRRHTWCYKWNAYADDVLPLWVAEMDFRSPQPVIDALKERVEHGIFGYTGAPDALRAVIVERMQRLYNWEIQPEWLLFNPGMVLTLNLITRNVGKAGDGVLMQTPVYGPFLTIPENQERFANMAPLQVVDNGDGTFRYAVDYDVFENAITKQTSLFYLCDPHNPGGRVFKRDELQRMGAICIEHGVTICEDAIHADLIMGDNEFVPIATLSPEIAAHTVTLIAPTKTYNIPGQPCSIAIIPDDTLRQTVEKTAQATGVHCDILSYHAALAAYQHGDAWLAAVRDYLVANRDFAVAYIQQHMPQIKTTVPEGTYLLWLDCNDLPIDRAPHDFFVEDARVALSPGTFFSQQGAAFARLNFACPREILADALDRMRDAVDALVS